MGRVVLKMHISLDGYARGPEGDTMDWLFRSFDDELKAWEVANLWEAGLHIMGRNVYEEMASHWPTSTEEFAPPMNDIPKLVFSKTVSKSNWKATRMTAGDVVTEIQRLKREPGKNILAHGGPTFAHALMKHRLIDVYHLLIHPVTLGGGLPLFIGGLDLVPSGTRRFPAGTLLATYVPATSRE